MQAKRRSLPSWSMATPRSTRVSSPSVMRRQAPPGSSGSPSSLASTFAVPRGRMPRVASGERPFITSFTVPALPGLGRELRGVVGVLRVKDLDGEPRGAQGLRVAFQEIPVARAPARRVTDDHRVGGRSHAAYYSPFTCT